MQFTFVGCSFTVGEGLALEKSDPDNYTNLIANRYSATVNNLAVSGNSNYNIFITAVNEILFNTPAKIFVQWSALNRLWVYPGINTKLGLTHTIKFDYKYRNIFYSKKELQKFTDTYHILNHDYNNLITLINYCNILTEISKNKTQLIFINGLLPWTSEMLSSDTMVNFSKNLSNYTKEILEFDSRDDTELLEFFTKLNIAVSSLNQSLWINMFDSMIRSSIDTGTDNIHPGPKSHALYADMIINYIEENNDKRI
jgi:hypothetical protein